MPCFVALVLRVVGVEGLQDDEEPEKGLRQVAESQWSGVVPHQPYWLPEEMVRNYLGMGWET